MVSFQVLRLTFFFFLGRKSILSYLLRIVEIFGKLVRELAAWNLFLATKR